MSSFGHVCVFLDLFPMPCRCGPHLNWRWCRSGGRLIHWRRWIWAQWFLELNHGQGSKWFWYLFAVLFFTQRNCKIVSVYVCHAQDEVEVALTNAESAVYRFCLWMVLVRWVLLHLESQWKSIWLFLLRMCSMNWPNLTCAARWYGHFLTKEAFTQGVTGDSGRKSVKNMWWLLLMFRAGEYS